MFSTLFQTLVGLDISTLVAASRAGSFATAGRNGSALSTMPLLFPSTKRSEHAQALGLVPQTDGQANGPRAEGTVPGPAL